MDFIKHLLNNEAVPSKGQASAPKPRTPAPRETGAQEDTGPRFTRGPWDAAPAPRPPPRPRARRAPRAAPPPAPPPP